MSINLPHHLAEVLNFLGFPWPDIDEDQLREAADRLRTYARDAAHSADTTQTRLTDLSGVYSSESYSVLVTAWSSQTRSHMDTLIEGCGLLADGLDIAATGVEVMKDAVIAQLVIAAAEFIADQAAAVATLGLAEAALPALYALQNRLLAAIVKTFELEVVTALVEKTLGPLEERIASSVNALLFPEIASAALGAKPALKVDTGSLRSAAASVGNEASSNETGGYSLASALSSYSFAGS